LSVAVTVAMADNTLYRPERVYMPGFEVEDLEAYTVGR
jgi:hypothetical protein